VTARRRRSAWWPSTPTSWISTSSIHELPHKLDVLRRHCDEVGRDFGDTLLTAGYFADPFADVDEYLRTLDRYAKLGIGLINTGPIPGNPDPEGWVKRLGDQVLTHFAA
jgi:hypothetical protein